MSIQSVKSFVVADNEKFDVKQELEELYKIKNNLVLDIEKYKEDKKKVKDLTSSIEKLSLKKTELDFEFFKLKQEHEEYSRSLKEIKGDVLLLEETKSKLLNDTLKLKKESEILTSNFKFEIDKTSKEIEIKNKEISDLNKLFSDKTAVILGLDKEIKVLSENNIKVKKENSELLKTRNKLLNENSELTTKMISKDNILNSIKKETEIEIGKQSKIISDFETKFNAKKMEANDAIEKMYKDKEKQIASKEGVISEKESWLMKREQKLKEIKTDLEVFYNKKIDNIIF